MWTKRGRQKGFSEEELKKNFETELADLLCQVLLLANRHNIDLMKRIEERWSKYQDERESKNLLIKFIFY